ncbi:MAG: AAA family ATPase [Erythrobacter sp.]|nr:AAA family ATPase [Erythrobacter sp.]
MNAQMLQFLRALPPILMVKTREEERVIQEIHETFKSANAAASSKKSKSGGKKPFHLDIWNPAFGLKSSAEYIDEMSALKGEIDKDTVNIHHMLTRAYQSPVSKSKGKLYIAMLDADNYVRDGMVRRRLLNIAISAHKHPEMQRTLIMVSTSGYLPEPLKPYVQVVDFDDPSDSLIRSFLSSMEADLNNYSKDFTLPAEREGNEIPHEFIRACRGMTLFQLKQTIERLAMSTKFAITLDHMQRERRSVIENSNLLTLGEEKLSFEDVAGLDRLKERLNEVKQAWTPEGRAWGVPNSRGLLMVGVPGCGKSLIAKALATEMGVTFINFDPSKLFSSRVGDSEAAMRQALNQIEACAPAVVFVDEIEKGLAGIQSSSYSDSGTTARVIGTFLSWFQDHDEDIFIIATANSINTLPPELVSRFEEKYFVGLPDQSARERCFEIQLAKYWKDTMGNREDVDIAALAEAASNLTGREIEQVVCDGIRKAFMSSERKVTTEILTEVTETKPPLIQTMFDQIRDLLGWVGFDPHRREGVRARYASSDRIVELEAMGYTAVETDGDRMSAMFGDIDTSSMN